MSYEYGALRGDDEEIRKVAEILSWAFANSVSDTDLWMRRAGLENIRVLRRDSAPAACLLFVPMGQFFGGSRVPMVGIAGVATAPEARGTGTATALMRAAVKELHESGAPLSTLYPATRTLYRRAGYEPAGGRFELKIPLTRIGLEERGLPVRLISDSDREAVVELYRESAAGRQGHLDRGEYVWNRVLNPRGESARGYAVERDGRIDGYVYLHEKLLQPSHYDVRVTDFAARSAESARRLLTFLADHATTGAGAYWNCGPADPLTQLLPEVGYELFLRNHWMVRVLDVAKALVARGYAEGMETELHLDVRDDLIPANSDNFVLQIAGGEGKVQRGGQGRLRLDVRGLAPLYTGHLSPAALVQSGLLEGEAADLRRAAAVFAGPAPWMPDMF